MLLRTTKVKLGLVLSFMHKLVHSEYNSCASIAIASHGDDVGHYNREDKIIDFELTALTQIFSGGVSFSAEAKTGRRRSSCNAAIFLPMEQPISIKSVSFLFSQMKFLVSDFWLFPRAQWSPY